MAKLTTEIKNFHYNNNCAQLFPSGSFAIDYENPDHFRWMSCREVVQLIYNPNLHKGLYFIIAGKIDRFVEFMNWVENSLNLGEDQTVIYQTNQRTLLWLKPAKFWQAKDMKVSMFTMFCRIAKEYSELATLSIKNAIKQSQYSGQCPIFLRFYRLYWS